MTAKVLRRTAAALLVLVAAAFALSALVSRPLHGEALDPAALESLPIAAPAEALTFARTRVDGRLHVLLVTLLREGRAIGVDLNDRLGTEERDPLALYRRLGYAELARQSASIAHVRGVELSALELPFDGREHNLAVGLNYREHAQESQLDEEPFLFPKFGAPVRFDSAVARRAGTLLDYEVEVGLVALEDLAPGAPPATMGLVLANEVTDRWALVRNFDGDAPMGTTGFADGKSGPDFAPVGPLLVIPRDLEAFVAGLELRLYANGRLRQRESAGAMIWGPRRILAEAFWRADWAYGYQGGSVPLLPAPRAIPAGTVVFSGTPAGVIFKPLNLWNPWVYLRPGDTVVLRAERLGLVRNAIVAAAR